MTSLKISSNNEERYLITPSLLNSWGWMWSCVDSVRESESDTMCLEDKIGEAQEKAKADFIRTLNRLPIEQNKYMQEGIEFEEECYKGNTCVSPIIANGCYQIVGMKNVTVKGMNFLMYGRLDVLKGGVIYDIKKVVKYAVPKYAKSYQHGFYLDLFKRAYKFEYLVYDGKNLHREVYYPSECENTENVIANFIEWLRQNNLLELYKEKWKSRK